MHQMTNLSRRSMLLVASLGVWATGVCCYLSGAGLTCDESPCVGGQPASCPTGCTENGEIAVCSSDGGGVFCGRRQECRIGVDYIDTKSGLHTICVGNALGASQTDPRLALVGVGTVRLSCTASAECVGSNGYDYSCINIRPELVISTGRSFEPGVGTYYEYCSGHCSDGVAEDTRPVTADPTSLGLPAFRMTEPCTPGAIIVRDDIPPVAVPSEP